jgi:Fuc2NAc and GlcNAc transferase
MKYGATLAVVSFITAAMLTWVARRVALAFGVIDIPNSRSSHTIATPRGGGAAVVVVTLGVSTLLWASRDLNSNVAGALLGGGALIALIGFLDDRRPIGASPRLVVHLGAALLATALLGGLPQLQVGPHVWLSTWEGYVLAVLGITWTLNLFNFMDGIDGIAASEAVFVALAGAALTAHTSAPGVIMLAVAFGTACAGFLVWNWPPARIFLGDVGSGFLGYVIAVTALADGPASPSALWVWLILGGVFFVDATVTLARRASLGRKVSAAHRSHAYQRLARRWRSHRKVTLTVAAVNVFWLLPCAAAAARYPEWALALVGMAFAPLVAVAWAVGAGMEEVPEH